MFKEYFYCPDCKSEDISTREWDDEGHYRRVCCNDCNYSWYEQFQIVGNYDENGEELGDPE